MAKSYEELVAKAREATEQTRVEEIHEGLTVRFTVLGLRDGTRHRSCMLRCGQKAN